MDIECVNSNIFSFKIFQLPLIKCLTFKELSLTVEVISSPSFIFDILFSIRRSISNYENLWWLIFWILIWNEICILESDFNCFMTLASSPSDSSHICIKWHWIWLPTRVLKNLFRSTAVIPIAAELNFNELGVNLMIY